MLELAIAATMLADTAGAAAPAQPPAPLTAQALFDAATQADEAGRFAEAVAGFEALENRPSMQRTPAVLGVIRIRKGAALYSLNRIDEAEAATTSGLAALPESPTELRSDRILGLLTLARLNFIRLDYSAATEQARRAYDLAEGPGARMGALITLIRSTTFNEGDAALHYAEEAVALLTAQPDMPKETWAMVRTLRGRALLNHGRVTDAYAELKKAVQENGGLGLRVDANDIAIRSDVAIAALLVGDKESARRYLAYTGAGRMKDSPLATAAEIAPPPCGGPADLRPDDIAVVEFRINEDGSVGYVQPIYASRNGPVALEFARTVAGWSWRTKDIAGIPPLFRSATRLELRCSTSLPRPPLAVSLESEMAQWLAAMHAPQPPAATSDAAAVAPLMAELSKRRAGTDRVAMVPVLLALANSSVTSPEDKWVWRSEALRIAIAAGAPVGARAYIESTLAIPQRRVYSNIATYRSNLRDLLARSEVAADARVAGTLKLMIADPQYRSSAPPDAEALVSSVANDSRLGKNDPLRVGALLRLSAIEARRGDLVSAARNYGQTGLSAEQCALADARPAMLQSNSASSKFPREAMAWGFEGWVRTEYDIRADGKTANQRVIVAYPPFVFRDAAIEVAKGQRYATTFRPDGGAGCGGEQQNLRFRILS